MKNKKILKNLVVSFFISKFAPRNQTFIAYKRKTTIIYLDYRVQITDYRLQIVKRAFILFHKSLLLIWQFLI